jgi:hypothetical protein
MATADFKSPVPENDLIPPTPPGLRRMLIRSSVPTWIARPRRFQWATASV